MKLFYIPVLSIAAISIASAGQIEIGAGQNGSGVSTQGLTAVYIGATTWSERNYVTNLFTNDTISNSSLNGVVGSSGAGNGTTLPTAGNGFQQFTDTNNNVTFGMLNDSTNGNNYWGSPSSPSSTVSSIAVPVSVSGVTSANILLSDYYGVAGQLQNDTIQFFFSNGAVQTFFLSNGNQIDSAHDCLVGNPTCPNFSGTTTNSNTDIAWSGSYAEAVTGTPFNGTSGNVTLIDRSFNLAAFAGTTLQGILIQDNFNLANSSRLVLSAVTVSGGNAAIVPTPEPSTVLLLLAGFGVFGILAHRRRART